MAMLIAATLCVALWARMTSSRAAGAALAAEAALNDVAVQARELGRLRAERAVVEERPRPEPDLVARLESQLQAAGIAPRAMAQLNSGAPSPLGRESGYRRRTVGVTIEGVSPEQAARFLLNWRAAEPLWSVRSVRLQHDARQGDGGETAYTCFVTLENVHLAQPAEAAS
jgi:hypothetical protein